MIDLHNYSTFLLDATGVLYNDDGPISGAQTVVQKMTELGCVRVVTNNSNNYPNQIAEKFKTTQFPILEPHIISSGHGLAHDAAIKSLIDGKKAFVFGKPLSHDYIYDANCAEIVSDINDCDVIVMTAIVRENQAERLEELTGFVKENPAIPVVCCNPDKIVKIESGKKYVIGHFARQLELATGVNVHWIGKPYDNFPPVVKEMLSQDSVSLDRGIFFDDNLENVMSFQRTLGVTGVWVIDSGISHNVDQKAHIEAFGQPDFILPSLSVVPV